MHKTQYVIRCKSLEADMAAALEDYNAGKINEARLTHVFDRAEAEQRKLAVQYESTAKAKSLSWVGDSAEVNRQNGQLTGFSGDFASHSKAKAISGLPSGSVQVSRGLSPADMDASSLQALYAATQSRTPFTVNLKSAAGETGGFAARAGNKALAASPVTEGIPSFSGLLPPVIRPDLAVEYLYDCEPRIADYLPTVEIDSQEIALPIEGRPTNQATDQSSPVPAVSELGTLSDAGLTWTTKAYRPIKLAALGSLSVELLDDASIFATLVPKTLSNALYAEEAVQILYGSGSSPNMTGLANTAGITALPAAAYMYEVSDTLIDAFINASAALRETPNFYQPATLILLNPSDWSGIKRIKNSLGDYVLSTINPNVVLADIDNIMGIRVVQTTHVNAGEAFVLNPEASMRYVVRQGIQIAFNPGYADTYWANMEVGYRVHMRSVLAVTRPQGVIHITWLGSDGS